MADHFVTPAGTDTWGNSVDPSTPCSLSTAISNVSAGDRVFLQIGTYSVTAQQTLSADGTSAAPIIWAPYSLVADDWDGTPGVVLVSGDGSFDVFRLNGEFNFLNGIRASGNRSVHNSGFRVVGDACQLFRCVATNVGSVGFLLAGPESSCIECGVISVGNANGTFGFKLQACRTTCFGCFAYDVVGLGFASSNSDGYDMGLYYCIASNISAGITPNMFGAGFSFENNDSADPIWGGTATQTRFCLFVHCVAYNCAVGFSVGDVYLSSNLPQPMWLFNCVVEGCSIGLENKSSFDTSALLFGVGFYNNTTDIASDVIAREVIPSTVFASSPFVDAANKDFRLKQTSEGAPAHYVTSVSALSSWKSSVQLGSAFANLPDLNEVLSAVQANSATLSSVKAKTDNLPADTNTKLDSMDTVLLALDGKIDDVANDAAIASTVAAKLPGGGQFIAGATDLGTVLSATNAVKAKTDALPADTASELDAIDSAIAGVSSGSVLLLSPLAGAKVPGNYFENQQKLGVFQGETKVFSLPIFASDGTTPIDLTAFSTLEFIVESASTGASVLSLTPSISGDDDNIAVVTTTAVALTAGEYRWKLWGDTSVLLYGTFMVLDSSKA